MGTLETKLGHWPGAVLATFDIRWRFQSLYKTTKKSHLYSITNGQKDSLTE